MTAKEWTDAAWATFDEHRFDSGVTEERSFKAVVEKAITAAMKQASVVAAPNQGETG